MKSRCQTRLDRRILKLRAGNVLDVSRMNAEGCNIRSMKRPGQRSQKFGAYRARIIGNQSEKYERGLRLARYSPVQRADFLDEWYDQELASKSKLRSRMPRKKKIQKNYRSRTNTPAVASSYRYRRPLTRTPARTPARTRTPRFSSNSKNKNSIQDWDDSDDILFNQDQIQKTSGLSLPSRITTQQNRRRTVTRRGGTTQISGIF